jgi:hypothetical protein
MDRQKLGRVFSIIALAPVVALTDAQLAIPAAVAQEQGVLTPNEVVPGSDCATEPRPITFLGDLIQTPAATQPYVAPTAMPEGPAPDDQTATEVTAVLRQFLACSNAGDVLRALALLSDDYLRRVSDPTGELDVETANGLMAPLASPIAIPANELVQFLRIVSMAQLADGRVAVVMETDGGSPNPEGTDVDLFVLKRFGDVWLIDDAVNDIDEIAAANANATPTS